MRDQVTLSQVKSTLSGCTLGFEWFGTRRVFEVDEREEAADGFGADSDAITCSKKLIDSRLKEWKDLTTLRSAIRAWWIYNTLPCPVEKQRYFLIKRRDEIFGQVAAYQKDLEEKVLALNEVRTDIISRAEKSLGRLFDASLFPPTFVGRFAVEMREVSIDPPSYLMHSNAEEYQRQLASGLADLEQGLHKFEQQTLSSLGEAAGRLMASLEDGSNPTGRNMEAFSKLFKRVSLMNFAGTQAFKSAIDDAREIINDCDLQDLRRDGGIRADAKEKLEKLLERHKSLQEAAKARVEAATA